ncbi:Abi family protein [Aeromonas sobria]|jgi:abortive infection bacteriophage resistance protein|uniref:Abi family protein n=1 Tax=Aeromonas sobria TaxID=646 RepID=UPI0011161DDF|nr:Abi family protein [Aeromonas sobria]TNH82533.1 CAAX protease [Aeromonas sobria]
MPPVAKSIYNKPYMNGLELADKLKKEGLGITSIEEASKYIENIGYFRLKAYFVPYKVNSSKGAEFKVGASFEDIARLYEFDTSLRAFVFKCISNLEVAMRARFDQHVTKITGNPFWYLDAKLFDSSGEKRKKLVDTVLDVRRFFNSSKADFCTHFKTKYFNDFSSLFNDLPPGWVAIEIMTYGNVMSLISSIDENAVNMKNFATLFGAKSYEQLRNWINVIHGARNICAHHSRLFNHNFPAPTEIKKKLSKSVDLVKVKSATGNGADQLNRLYTVLAVLRVMSSSSGVSNDIGPMLNSLLAEYNIPGPIKHSMGIPDEWMNEPLFL